MKDLHIHVGASKTGTTAIQYYFYGQPNAARARYLPVGLQYQGHHGVAAAIMGQARFDWMHEYDLDRLRLEVRELGRLEQGSYFASSEVFSTFEFIRSDGLPRLKELFEDWDIKIIYFVRNQIALFESSYLQVAKTGAFLGNVNEWYDEFQLRKMGDFAFTVGQLQQVFGRNRVHTIVFDEHKDDLMAPIEKIMGIAIDRTKVGHENMASILASLVLQAVAKDTGQRLISHSSKKLREVANSIFRDNRARTIVPTPLAKRILRDYERQNEQLKAMANVDLESHCKLSDLPEANFSTQEIEAAKSELLLALAERLPFNR